MSPVRSLDRVQRCWTLITVHRQNIRQLDGNDTTAGLELLAF
jgi:hypothetical protein